MCIRDRRRPATHHPGWRGRAPGRPGDERADQGPRLRGRGRAHPRRRPRGSAMLHASAAAGRHLDAFVVRKSGKAHGLQQRIEGPSIRGRRVLIVEDTTTTGASPMDAVAAAREEGAEVVAVATIADRATGAREKLEAQGLTYVTAYSLHELGLA